MAVFAKNIEVEFAKTETRPGLLLRRVISVNLESSWENLTDTCTITISRYIKGLSTEDIRNYFRRGDAVAVRAGYNGTFRQEFTGYIVNVTDDQHLVLKCEDEMFQLKTGKVDFNKKKCTLKDVLNELNASLSKQGKTPYPIDAIEAELGSVRIRDLSPARVLQEIKDKYHIYCFFRDGKLIGGKPYSGNEVRTVLRFDGERNIKTHNLTFRKAEDIRLKVKVTSTMHSGKKIEVTVGDEDGQQSELAFYGIDNKSDLKKKAEEKLAMMKVDGYEGEITLFGVPFVKFGDEVEIKSEEHPERDGTYLVDSVKWNYGDARIERQIKIGRRAA